MYTYTIICYGAEIAYGQGATFTEAKREAESQVETSEWYPREDWGYISVAPSGLTVRYNIDN